MGAALVVCGMKPTPKPETGRMQILALARDPARVLGDDWREHQLIFDGVPLSSIWLTSAAADYLIEALSPRPCHEVDETSLLPAGKAPAAGYEWPDPLCICGALWSQSDGGCQSAAAEVVRLRTTIAEVAPVMLAARSALHALASVLPLEE